MKKEIKKPKAEKPANAEGKQKKEHLWKKGQSGNPGGKKPGTRHRITLLAEKLLDKDAKDLVKKCIEMAKEGDGPSMRICMDRILPPRKDRPVNIALPLIESLTDATRAMAFIANAVSVGEITPSEGQVLSVIIENYRKIVETTELEKRIIALESSS